MSHVRRILALGLFICFFAPFTASPATELSSGSFRPGLAYAMTLPDGRYAEVYRDGKALIYPSAKDRSRYEPRQISSPAEALPHSPVAPLDKARVMLELAKDPPPYPYATGWVEVVYRSGISAPQDSVTVSGDTLVALRHTVENRQAISAAPHYTNDAALNRTLATLGVDRSERLFRGLNRSALAALHSGIRTPQGQPLPDFSNAYRVHVTNASVPTAVRLISQSTAVVYASPDWLVGAMNTRGIPLNAHAEAAAQQRAQAMSDRSTSFEAQGAGIPHNYASASSLQSMLNAPSDDVMAAYDEIWRHFHQIPGKGEIITNVSLGDLDDARAAADPNDPCNSYVSSFGPTTEMIGGQRYIDLPSLPLIPTYTADVNGDLSSKGEVCGVDPGDGEIDLDFSMMAPLPHRLQRPGERGAGYTDLLGIAPGAQYRLVVPSDPAGTDTDLQAAFLAAASQTPRPNVISASIGFGEDVYGFPSRYLEDDPLLESIIASIVKNDHIVVVISANDGTRTFTDAAIGPSGGAAATEKISGGAMPTSLGDVGFTTLPSNDYDSGAIDAGGVTLDDIFANPPQYATTSRVQAQHAYAETRWTGFTSFASGFGSRVDLSAPADNVIAFEHASPNADSVAVTIQGGTSASAPQIAAAAAVVQQVARLTGHPFNDPEQVRAFLQRTGTPVPRVTQADVTLNVGPQIDLRRSVETLVDDTGMHGRPSVPRVAVEQRRWYAFWDGAFLGDTDPADIDLQDSSCGPPTRECTYRAQNENGWITVAPDWESAPAGAKYTLKVAGRPAVLATTPWARAFSLRQSFVRRA